MCPTCHPPVPSLAVEHVVGRNLARPWVVSSASEGMMRLMVAAEPPWPDEVVRAAALVDVLDARHRADRADAQEIADELEGLLAALRRKGVPAWLAS